MMNFLLEVGELKNYYNLESIIDGAKSFLKLLTLMKERARGEHCSQGVRFTLIGHVTDKFFLS